MTTTGKKYWVFTLNNYSDEDTERINQLVSIEGNNIIYLIYGKEIGESGTPHLQGFLALSKKTRLTSVKNLIGSNPHLEQCRSPYKAIEYCKKDGDIYEFGTIPSNMGQGSRSDLNDFKEAVKSGEINRKRLREEHSECAAKYPHFFEKYINDNMPEVEIPEFEFRPWQRELDQILQQQPDRRQVIFIVDINGNSGKSWFADYYQKKYDEKCQILTPDRRNDMAYAVRIGIRWLFLDAPRSKQSDNIMYDFLENMKDGRIFSPKYDSHMKRFDPLHVVVCMNEFPDMTKLSRDRYKIINVDEI
jgi:hypothetical protein